MVHIENERNKKYNIVKLYQPNEIEMTQNELLIKFKANEIVLDMISK